VPDEPYRAPLPIEPDPYLSAWRDLRRRRAWSAAIVLAYFALTVDPVPKSDGAGGKAVVWTLGLVVVLFLLPHNRFRCPHCGRKGPIWWKRCRECGITVGTPKSAAVQAEKRSTTAPTDT
jgi:hypothetical protein